MLSFCKNEGNFNFRSTLITFARFFYCTFLCIFWFLINKLKQSVILYFRGCRCISSVLPEAKVADFPFQNEPILGYERGSPERAELERALEATASTVVDVPIVIGGQEIRTGDERLQTMPHDHGKAIARYRYANKSQLLQAAKAATEAQRAWDLTPIEERVRTWLRAADLLAGPYRQRINAATMLGQGKTVVQAEIDSAAELIDFFRMSAWCAKV